MTSLIQQAHPRSSLVPVITARRKATKPKTAGRKEVVRLDSVPRGSGSQKGRVARTRLQLLMLMVVNPMEFGSQMQPPQMMKMTGSEKLMRRLFSPVWRLSMRMRKLNPHLTVPYLLAKTYRLASAWLSSTQAHLIICHLTKISSPKTYHRS